MKKTIETNASVLKRKVVSLDDRKTLGPIAGLRIDCDSMAVGWYVIGGTATGTSRALPLESSVGMGDTFLTVQSRDALLPVGPEAKSVIEEGFKLVDCIVYSRGGDELGKVKSFEYDPVMGTITSIELDKNTSFDRDAILFFDSEYVFVDDGKKTISDLRVSPGEEEELEHEEVRDDSQESLPLAQVEPIETVPDTPEDAYSEPEESDEIVVDSSLAELREYLLGKKTVSACNAPGGSFSIPIGTILTEELIDDAEANDSLVLLVMCVEG